MNAPTVLRPGTEGDHLARTILAALPPGERREAYALARWFLRALAALSVVCGACGPRGCVTRHAGAREARDAVDALCSIAHTAAAAVTGSPHRGAVNALLCATLGGRARDASPARRSSGRTRGVSALASTPRGVLVRSHGASPPLRCPRRSLPESTA